MTKVQLREEPREGLRPGLPLHGSSRRERGLARGVRSRPRRRLGREALARGHRLERQDRAPVPMLVNFDKGRQVEFTDDVAGCCDRYERFLALSSKT